MTGNKEQPEAEKEKIIDIITKEAPLEVEKDVIKSAVSSKPTIRGEKTFDVESWRPKSLIGQKIKSGEITQIDQILNSGLKIVEVGIVDTLLPNLDSELLMIGQSKGKFGGGQKRVFKQTQKKTPEGNKPSFATVAAVGNKNGYVGIGQGKSKDTVPAREKALRNAKLKVFKINRGCGSWSCNCKTPHSIPFEVTGKCGSSNITLIPAPKGKGLCISPECAKILELAGIKDIWSKTRGKTAVKRNVIKACVSALQKLVRTKVRYKDVEALGLVEGHIKNE